MTNIKRTLLLPLIALAFHAAGQEEKPDTVSVATYDLDDLIVETERPLVQSDGAKLTYNMEEDTSAKGQTLSDAMRKIPLVTVDADGNITIKGQSGFKVYVNGKEDPSMTANYKTIFKAMPAESVVKVEVITEPGAKYDAEGVAGIINLVTVSKKSTDGWWGNASISFMRRQTGAYAYGGMRRGKTALSANISYANGRLFKQENNSTQTMENLASEDRRKTVTSFNQRTGWDYVGGSLNFSSDLSASDLITAQASVNKSGGGIKNASGSAEYFNANGESTGLSLLSTTADMNWISIDANAAWQHTFGEEGHNMIFSYKFSRGSNELDYSQTNEAVSGETFQSPCQMSSNDGKINENTFQLDYTKPFGEKHKFETGAKAVVRRNPAISSTKVSVHTDGTDASVSESSDMTQKQDIVALYATYSARFGKFSAGAGLRYEYTSMGIEFHEGELPDFSNRLNDLVPNASLTWLFSSATNLRASYQMRISRPSLDQVNPYRFSYIPGLVNCGNPDLESQKANKFSLAYSSYGRTLGGNLSAEYSSVNNGITSYSYSDGDDYISTYANIGKNRSVNFSGFLNWSVFPFLQLSANAQLSHNYMSTSDKSISSKGWSGGYGGNVTVTDTKYRITLYGGQDSRRKTLQGWSSGWYYYGIGINRSFLKKDALTVSLNASNFLQKNITYRSYSSSGDITTRSWHSSQHWDVGVSVSYNFGNMSGDVKKTSKSINNDDTEASGKKSGGLL